MKLNKNERKTLKLLLSNAKISDRAIANDLKISSQAVGKIRRKLERNLIKSYSLNLDYAKLGIQTFAISLARITPEGLEEGVLQVEQRLLKDANIINIYRLPSGVYTHVIMYGFKDISEMENFFHSNKKKNEIHKFIENQQLFTFSHNSLIKNNPTPLFYKLIDEIGENQKPNSAFTFEQTSSFKRRLC